MFMQMRKPIKKRIKKYRKKESNKVLIFTCLVLLAVTVLTVGMLLQSPSAAAQTNSNGPRLIDSGSTIGYDTYAYGNFKYEWRTYEYNNQHFIIQGTLYLQDEGRTVKQTQDVKKFSDETVVILAIPKWTGKNNYETVTTNWGYYTVTDYYWNVLRPRMMIRGPYGL